MRRILPLFAFGIAVSAPVVAAEVVPVPRFDSVRLIGGGRMVVRPGPVQRVTLVEGSRQYTGVRVMKTGELRIDACNQRCPRQYRLEILVESPSAPDLGVWGGGSITVAPGFREQREISAAVSGGGNVDLRAVPVADASAAINGGGEIRIHARRRLSGAVNGGGLIRYWGNPRVASAVNGGGAVSRGQ